MTNQTKKSILVILAVIGIVFIKSAMAETAPTAEEVKSQQTELQKQLEDIERQIREYQSEIKTVQGEKKTLQNKITQLKKQSNILNLKINATNLEVAYLRVQISDTERSIEKNTARIEELKEKMERLLLLLYKIDNYSILYPLFGSENFSDVFIEAENYIKITEGVSGLLAELKSENQELADNQNSLAEKEEANREMLAIQSLQKKELSESVSEQSTLLTETKGKESNYQAMLTDTQKRAKAIRDRLYSLLEVEKQITFGQAVQIAQWASEQTGVRAAFLLAILTQESNLGKNVGTCNREKDPPSKSWKAVMHPTRDQPHFKTITSELGLNIDTTPISCPMKRNGKQIGWGGAMGPAQFIPSTWMGYRDKITAITGKTADPWDIRDAFLASAIKLAHDGAKTKSGEWAAAMRYFSGSTNTRYRFYGDSVVARADAYQEDIDALNK